MAKFTRNLPCLGRIPFRLFLFQKTVYFKLWHKSTAPIYANTLIRLNELRQFSTRCHLLQRSYTGSPLKVNHEADDVKNRQFSEQEQLLVSEIEGGNIRIPSDWERLKTKTFSIRGHINPYNFDAVAMGFCISARQYKMGLSLLDHIQASGKEPNMATLARFLRLCSVCYNTPAPKGVQEVIAVVYSKLKALCPEMDAATGENAVQGLVLTDKWKEAIEVMSVIKVSAVPSGSTYNALARVAFEHDDVEIGWALMTEMFDNGRRPIPSTYCALLDFCMDRAGRDVGHAMVEKLFMYFIENDLRPTEEVVVKLQAWFKRENPLWKSSKTTLTNKGICKSCKKSLESIAITKEEFGALRSNFIDKVVVGSNVFLKTTPEELESFQKFLERSIPFNVVIDGLNVAYSAKSAKNVPHSAYLLQSVVKHFADKSQKIVLFGRKHMKYWPKGPMNYVFSHTRAFLAENISQDDPFLLYAAMYGGLGTNFVSRDQMRGHLYLLKDPALKAIFKRWQQRHQFSVVYIGEEGDVQLKPPLSFNPSIQRRPDGGGWHIPYDKEFVLYPPQRLDAPTHWLCLGPKPEGKRTVKAV